MIENYHDRLLAGIGSTTIHSVDLIRDRIARKRVIEKARQINKNRKIGDPFYMPKL